MNFSCTFPVVLVDFYIVAKVFWVPYSGKSAEPSPSLFDILVSI